MTSPALEISLTRASRVYNQTDDLTGTVIIDGKSEIKHEGIALSVDGTISVQPNPKSARLVESLYSNNSNSKPVTLINYSLELSKAAKLAPGRNEISFSIPLKPLALENILFETYHGVYITIQYMIKCYMKRSILTKDIIESLEFYVEYSGNQSNQLDPIQFDIRPQPMIFTLNPDSIEAVNRSHQAKRENIPKFQISGLLDSYICKISEPFTGEFVIDYCEAKIRSIELQLVRVETCGNLNNRSKDFAREATEIQSIQIGDGDIERGAKIPIYMIFPRFFTCPTLKTENFRIEFEVNLVVIFEDNHLLTENFPVKLVRGINQPISI